MSRSPDFFVGRTLPGRTQLAEPIGSGAFGTAYKAYELGGRNPREPVAVKLYRRDADILSVARFLEEAFHLARLQHPNIIPVRRVGVEQVTLQAREGEKETTEHYPFIVMKYANIGNARRLKPRDSTKPVPVEPVLAIASSVGEALQFAHDSENPLLHLDVKPENMLLDKDPGKPHVDVYLTDFGIAITAHTFDSLEPQKGIGTPPYMAPEQFSGQALRQTDQYALAVFVYEYLTGRLPFERRGRRDDVNDFIKFMQWHEIHLYETPQPFEEVLRATGRREVLEDRRHLDLLQRLQPIILKALEKNPQDRYDRVTTFTRTLREVAKEGAMGKLSGKPFLGVDLPTADVAQQEGEKISTTVTIASALIKQGNELQDQRKNEEALQVYERALQLDPNNVEAMVNKAGSLIDLDRYTEALQVSEQAIALDPNNVQGWFLKGLALCRFGKYQETLEPYDRALQLEPNHVLAMRNKADSLNKLERYEEALTLSERAIQFEPDFPLSWFDKGIALYALGRYEEAIAALDQGIRLDPNDSKAHTNKAYNNKGNSLTSLGRNEEALTAYDEAIRLNPNSRYAYNSKGIALHALGRNEEAIAAYDEAIRLDPNNVEALANKGECLLNLGRNEEALTAYDEAIRLNPNNSNQYNDKGYALNALDKNEEAIAALDQGISVNPNNSQLFSNKGLLLENLGRYEEAIAAYDEAIRLDPNNTILINNKNELLQKLQGKKKRKFRFKRK